MRGLVLPLLVTGLALCAAPGIAAEIAATTSAPAERVYVDRDSVIRWRADDREVALFGANYCLASACDYRAAGYVQGDRKELVRQDFAHFVRMGWDGVRLCFWGDWENADPQGNLIANDHLDVLDMAIAEAKRRDIAILFTPITTYSSLWPDGKDSPDIKGFSKAFPKDQLGTNPAAIAAQCNYLRQILEHVNPYTGVALKNEPAIVLLEMINEPTHHSADLGGSVAYINALADAVRDTGCKKLLFHNLSQDFAIAPAIRTSTVPGLSFAWYPTGLVGGRTLEENHLRTVDDYPPMWAPALRGVPTLVYEFDSADMNSGCMYPAMVRSFRGAGAQFIAMFSYDMLATAPYNLGWQTHFLNLVYSPTKAVSAIIAAEATKRLPRYTRWGDYPDNCQFGPFRVSYEEDSSEMVTDEEFLHANTTRTLPPKPAALQRVVGVGSSPLVAYEASGAYFLDRIEPGVWRLEVYPDAVTVLDPFAQRLNYQTPAVRLVNRAWPMTLRLPDLGETFAVEPLNAGNTYATHATNGRFEIRPGAYVLGRQPVKRAALPAQVRGLALAEFVCPATPDVPAQVLMRTRSEYLAGETLGFEADVVDEQLPRAVTLHVRAAGGAEYRAFPMARVQGYRHRVDVPAGTIAGETIEYYVAAEFEGERARCPTADGEVLTAQVAAASEPLRLFAAGKDVPVFTRIGDTVRHGIFKNLPATDTDPAALRLYFPFSYDATLDDYTASVPIKRRMLERGAGLAAAGRLRLTARGSAEGRKLYLTLVERDGTSWGAAVNVTTGWRQFDLPLDQLRLTRGVMLPLGYPGRWNYWLTPARGRGRPTDRPQLAAVEHVQISLRPDAAIDKPGAEDAWVDVASVTLEPKESPAAMAAR